VKQSATFHATEKIVRHDLFHRGLRLAILVRAFLLLLILCGAPEASAGQITVAAAADLTFAFKDVSARFEKQTGNSIKLSYGSSGNYFSQIKNGAPYDLFFSADIDFPKKLEAAGLIEPGSIYEYAVGKIVIWVPNSSKLDLGRGLKVLLDPGIHKIAIANPRHAPYGRAAVAAIQHEGIYDQVKSKFVMGEDISQTAQFVQSGNADVGIVALSLALAPAMKTKGRYIEVPTADYPSIVQAAVILKSSQNKEVAKQFLKFLKEPATLALMADYGFTVPK
jgi:molybdate transport system substrate-binding protein